MVDFVVGNVVDEDDHDAVVVLIEDGIGDHHAVAGLDTDVAIGVHLHQVTSMSPPSHRQVTANDFKP
jgi:hypothetical protein